MHSILVVLTVLITVASAQPNRTERDNYRDRRRRMEKQERQRGRDRPSRAEKQERRRRMGADQPEWKTLSRSTKRARRKEVLRQMQEENGMDEL